MEACASVSVCILMAGALDGDHRATIVVLNRGDPVL
jgi:hypothetical protein